VRAGWLIVALVTAGLAVGWWALNGRGPGSADVAPGAGAPARPLPVFTAGTYPTDRDRFDPGVPGVFMPTASGRPESALYGSVRTTRKGPTFRAQFHEGIDIAPLRRDARGAALDPVRAVAAGSVGFVNRQPGNSSYGNYVVLLHADPLGPVYTLYAHLASVAPGLAAGQGVRRGQALGVMGRTPFAHIPVERSHLHFEVGLVANARFGEWFRARKLTPDHGMFNGLNLFALDPLAFFAARDEAAEFGFADVVRATPVAYVVMIPAARGLDYFRRYPGLWQGPAYAGGWMVLACSENGTPLSGRAATADEAGTARGATPRVLKADAAVLGRNGCGLVVKDNGHWRLGEQGRRWLELLTY
jgi:murein DD-endopeptidase MepM/ murein hydrolase activator NlpD